MPQPSTSSVLSVLVSPDERTMFEAADQVHATLGDFVRRKALEVAEADVVGRTVVTIPAGD